MSPKTPPKTPSFTSESLTSKGRTSKSRTSTATRLRSQAPIFAALGDRTRLALVLKLSGGEPRSISQLTRGSRITRQAITKHLRVLESAGVARSIRAGRESLFEFNPQAIGDMQEYLNFVSRQWDDALLRLKSFVEN